MAARRAAGELRFISWQEFLLTAEATARLPSPALARAADSLRVLTGETLLEGEGAWAFLLERYRDLAGLNWMASRLGLTQPVAKVLERSGGVLKRFCWSCRGH